MIVPALAVRLYRLLTQEKNLDEARALWMSVLPIIRLEYRAMGTNEGSPHWLPVCRESAALRGIPVASRGRRSRQWMGRCGKNCVPSLHGLGQLNSLNAVSMELRGSL